MISKEELYELYVEKEMSTVEIGKMIGVDSKTVWSWLRKYGIKTRSIKEAAKINMRKRMKRKMENINLDDELFGLIDGLLLGDGSILCSRGRNCYLSITLKRDNADMLMYVKEKFKEKHINSYLTWNKGKEFVIKGMKTKRKPTCRLDTQNLLLFTEQRKRWYNGGKKLVPRDLQLSPLSAALWYMGDGSLHCREKYKLYAIYFYTNGFSEEDVRYLSSLLNSKFDLESRVFCDKRKEWMIGIYKQKDVFKFLKITEKYKVPSFEYKWRAMSDRCWLDKVMCGGGSRNF